MGVVPAGCKGLSLDFIFSNLPSGETLQNRILDGLHICQVYVYAKTCVPLIRFLLHLGTANKFLIFYPFTDNVSEKYHECLLTRYGW